MKGQALTQLRQSHAAGIHDSAPTRSALESQAIIQDMEDSGMSVFDEDYLDEDFFDDEVEPSQEDLDEIENEDYVPLDIDDEDYPHETQREPYGLYPDGFV